MGSEVLQSHQPELGRSSAEKTSAAVLLLQAPVWTMRRLSHLSTVVRAEPRGLQGAAAVPLLMLMITSDSPPTQPRRGRPRDAIADKPLLLTATTCLPGRTDGISHGSVGKRPGLLGHEEPPRTPPGHVLGGGGGTASEMQL